LKLRIKTELLEIILLQELGNGKMIDGKMIKETDQADDMTS